MFNWFILNVSRTSIVLGTAIPLALFLVWNAVILGSFTGSDIGSGQMIDPLEQLRSSNGVVGVSTFCWTWNQTWMIY